MPNIYTPPTNNDTVGIYEFFSYVNNISEGIFFTMLLFIIFIVVFIATKQFTASRALTYSSFVSVILGIPLAVLGLIGPKFMYLFIILLGVGVVWMKLEVGQTF